MRPLLTSILSLFIASAIQGTAAGNIPNIYNPGTLLPTDSQLLVAVGQTAPDFELPAVDGSRIRLSDYRGKRNIILTFVPAAWTPVCSAQWPGYNLMEEEFSALDATVVGITVDNIPALHAWTEAMDGIGSPILSTWDSRKSIWYPVLRWNHRTCLIHHR
ncbi:MAG: redoxin domain-containing protein [Opitutales bacterium]|jgi:hypothetical protein|nr:redoxin domain-containing protein [Opitutales bacterium]